MLLVKTEHEKSAIGRNNFIALFLPEDISEIDFKRMKDKEKERQRERENTKSKNEEKKKVKRKLKEREKEKAKLKEKQGMISLPLARNGICKVYFFQILYDYSFLCMLLLQYSTI